MKKLLAIYTRDDGGLHCKMKDIETKEVVHTITVDRFTAEWMPRFVKEVKSWAARNDMLIVEEAGEDDDRPNAGRTGGTNPATGRAEP